MVKQSKEQIAAGFASMTDGELAQVVTPHWERCTTLIPKLNEAEVLRLLKWETRHRQNAAILQRLHQRYTRMRGLRERAMLEAGDYSFLAEARR